jgi:hypothetical protein
MAGSHLVLNLPAHHFTYPFRIRRPQVRITLTPILHGKLLCAHRTKWRNQTVQANHVVLGPSNKFRNRLVRVPCLWARVEPEVTIGVSVFKQNRFALSTRLHRGASLPRTSTARPALQLIFSLVRSETNNSLAELSASTFLRIRPRQAGLLAMSGTPTTSKISIVTAGEPTLFDSLARLVPKDWQTAYYRVLAHTRTLSPDDECCASWRQSAR